MPPHKFFQSPVDNYALIQDGNIIVEEDEVEQLWLNWKREMGGGFVLLIAGSAVVAVSITCINDIAIQGTMTGLGGLIALAGLALIIKALSVLCSTQKTEEEGLAGQVLPARKNSFAEEIDGGAEDETPGLLPRTRSFSRSRTSAELSESLADDLRDDPPSRVEAAGLSPT